MSRMPLQENYDYRDCTLFDCLRILLAHRLAHPRQLTPGTIVPSAGDLWRMWMEHRCWRMLRVFRRTRNLIRKCLRRTPSRSDRTTLRVEGKLCQLLAHLETSEATDSDIKALAHLLPVAIAENDKLCSLSPQLLETLWRVLHPRKDLCEALQRHMMAMDPAKEMPAFWRCQGGYGWHFLKRMTGAPRLSVEQMRLTLAIAAGECLLLSGRFAEAVDAFHTLMTEHSGDLRVQDGLFRARYYQAHGVPPRPGYEMAGRFCPHPFSKFEVTEEGHMHVCCAVWMPQEIGNLFDDGRHAWNSDQAQAIRESIYEGSYRWCGKQACFYLQQNTLRTSSSYLTEDFYLQEIPQHRTWLDRWPAEVNLSYDKSCNLACVGCRKEKMVLQGEALETRLQVTRHEILPLLKTTDTVFLTGSGDPFVSKICRLVMEEISDEEYPHLRVILMTNGLLFTKDRWEALPQLHQRMRRVNVSVDAATPETYARIRRGGDFASLVQNLRFIGSLHKEGLVPEYCLCFVVQDANMDEMKAFVELAWDVGAGEVHFQLLHNWGTFAADEYRHLAVQLPEHPRHEEFLAILRDPLFRDSRVRLEASYLLESPEPSVQ